MACDPKMAYWCSYWLILLRLEQAPDESSKSPKWAFAIDLEITSLESVSSIEAPPRFGISEAWFPPHSPKPKPTKAATFSGPVEVDRPTTAARPVVVARESASRSSRDAAPPQDSRYRCEGPSVATCVRAEVMMSTVADAPWLGCEVRAWCNSLHRRALRVRRPTKSRRRVRHSVRGVRQRQAHTNGIPSGLRSSERTKASFTSSASTYSATSRVRREALRSREDTLADGCRGGWSR